MENSGAYYTPEEIERIRTEAQNRPEVANVSLVRGYYHIQQINRQSYPSLKINLTQADCEFGEGPEVYKSVFVDCSGESLCSEALESLWTAFKTGAPVYLMLNVEYKTDGTVNRASVSAIGEAVVIPVSLKSES